jgi:hypothetical protein
MHVLAPKQKTAHMTKQITSYALCSTVRSPGRGSQNATVDDIKRNPGNAQTRSKNVKQQTA